MRMFAVCCSETRAQRKHVLSFRKPRSARLHAALASLTTNTPYNTDFLHSPIIGLHWRWRVCKFWGWVNGAGAVTYMCRFANEFSAHV